MIKLEEAKNRLLQSEAELAEAERAYDEASTRLAQCEQRVSEAKSALKNEYRRIERIKIGDDI